MGRFIGVNAVPYSAGRLRSLGQRDDFKASSAPHRIAILTLPKVTAGPL